MTEEKPFSFLSSSWVNAGADKLWKIPYKPEKNALPVWRTEKERRPLFEKMWKKKKNVLIELLKEPIRRALKKLKLTKRNLLSNSITSIEEIWITSFHGTSAGSVILSYEKQFFFFFCDGLKTCVNLRYQSKYQSTSYIYWLLQQLVFFKVCILEKKKRIRESD